MKRRYFLIFFYYLFLGHFLSGCTLITPRNIALPTRLVQNRQVEAPKAEFSVGIGLNGISDWSTQYPFIDHFKSARYWITQCHRRDPNCEGQWSTEESELLDLDENGWVKSLPKPEDKAQFTRVSTLLLTGAPEEMKQDKYIVLYDGEGTIEYGLGVSKIPSESTLGRDVVRFHSDSRRNAPFLLTITATDPNNTGNYIRNIRVISAQQEDLYNQGKIFNPLFLEKIKPFSTLRFMDWMKTNNSEQKEWKNRPTPEIFSYAFKGVSIETMIALGNKLRKDLWFNIPHQATDEYITNFAQLVKDKLDPSLKIYVEFSNEVWNRRFKQANYAMTEAKQRWNQEGDARMQWYGMRTAQMCNMWKTVFGAESERVICVISTQTAWQGLEKAILDCPLWVKEGNKPCYQHNISAYAITGYFGGALGNPENESTLNSWLRDTDGGFSKGLQQLKVGGLLPSKGQDSLVQTLNSFLYHQKVAQERGLQLVAYEGGQHIVGVGRVKENESLTNFFIELNRHPEMYDLYMELLANWEKAGGGLFMHFVDIGRPSRHGSWGALEYLQQPESPKYNALLDLIKRRESQLSRHDQIVPKNIAE